MGAVVRFRSPGGSLRRFASPTVEVERSRGLTPGHPALAEARTLFPSTVVETWESPRFLISGANNPKLGKVVVKGPRAGWPIFHVTLEERATCPRSCPHWGDCYGNAMPYARRHRPDEDFIGVLKAEVLTLARQHPDGLLIRLHALGDFYSLEYVFAWRDLIASLPQLHVFGYTARRDDADDAESRAIAREIRRLTEQNWEQFAIRFSRPVAAPQGAIVSDAPIGDERVIMCPAQTGKTTACATCGLCWAEAARDKTIGFLRHGMKTRKAPAVAAPARAPERPTSSLAEPDIGVEDRGVSDDDLLIAWNVERLSFTAIGRRYGQSARWVEKRLRYLGALG